MEELQIDFTPGSDMAEVMPSQPGNLFDNQMPSQEMFPSDVGGLSGGPSIFTPEGPLARSFEFGGLSQPSIFEQNTNGVVPPPVVQERADLVTSVTPVKTETKPVTMQTVPAVKPEKKITYNFGSSETKKPENLTVRKRQRRLESNRVSAQRSRDRKNQYIGELEVQVQGLADSNKELERQNQALKAENNVLKEEIDKFHNTIREASGMFSFVSKFSWLGKQQGQPDNVKKASFVMMAVFSFALLLPPGVRNNGGAMVAPGFNGFYSARTDPSKPFVSLYTDLSSSVSRRLNMYALGDMGLAGSVDTGGGPKFVEQARPIIESEQFEMDEVAEAEARASTLVIPTGDMTERETVDIQIKFDDHVADLECNLKNITLLSEQAGAAQAG